MSSRSVPLFDREGRPTPFLMAQWRQRSAAQPLYAGTRYLDTGRAGLPVLRGLWAVAFPLRDPLPHAPLANSDGTGTQRWWDVFGE